MEHFKSYLLTLLYVIASFRLWLYSVVYTSICRKSKQARAGVCPFPSVRRRHAKPTQYARMLAAIQKTR